MNNPQMLPEGAAFTRHRGPVTCVAGVPGQNAAISVGYDSAVAWVDLDRGQMTLLGYHDHLVNAVSVNAAGTRAATSSSDYTVCIWDLATHEPERILRGHHDDVNGFAFVDDDIGASVSHDHRVYVWDLNTGAVRMVLEGHRKYAMSVDAAEGLIYSSGDDMTLRQWDARTGAQLRCWGPFEVETDSCAIDGPRGRVVLGADDGVLRIFDSRTGAFIGEIQAHDSGIKKVSVSPLNGDILSSGYDQRLRVWDAASFRHKVDLKGHPSCWERSLNWSPDGRFVLGGTFDGTVLVWDVAAGADAEPVEIGAGEEARGNICINDVSGSDSGAVAFVSDDGFVRLASLTPDGGDLLSQVAPLGGPVLMNGVTLDSARGRVLAGAHDHHLHAFVRDGTALRARQRVPILEGPINCVRVSDHPSAAGCAFVACYSGAVVKVSPEGGILDRWRHHEGAVKALRVHPTRPLGVSCSADGNLTSWTLDGEVLRRFNGHFAIADDVDLDPSGERVGTVSRDFTLKVYALDSGVLIASRPLGQRSPKSMCFWSRDVVIVGNYWGWLLRFDLVSGAIREARVAGNGISSLTRHGPHVVAASYDGALYLVDPDSLEVRGSLRFMHQRAQAETISGRHAR